jgi:serine/threonine-protein kinase ATR
LRTHVKGVLIRNPEWESSLAGFHVESSWIVGDWADVRRIVDTTNAESSPIIFARLLLMMQEPDPVPLGKAFIEARMQLGGPISKSGVAGHRQSYDSLVDLQLLRELELIHAVETKKNRKHDDLPRLSHNLSNRLDLTLPTFRNRERILSFRRTAYKLRYTLLQRV